MPCHAVQCDIVQFHATEVIGWQEYGTAWKWKPVGGMDAAGMGGCLVSIAIGIACPWADWYGMPLGRHGMSCR
jgi:hypothetical protein